MIFIGLFIPISKVDEENRLVYGVAAAEEVDNANEVFDYDSSKPYIQNWSNSFIEKTNGLSCGNLRAMHRPISAGKVVELSFDDEKKSIPVCVKIVDEAEWQKTLEGVYTGFSFAGQAVKKWHDPALNAKRYTLKPSELSLADKPCVPSAVFFEVLKTDGAIEKRKFKNLGGSGSMKKTDNANENPGGNSTLAELLKTLDNLRQSEDNQLSAELKEAIGNLITIAAKTGSDKPSVSISNEVVKEEVAEEINKILSPFSEAVQKITLSLEDIKKTAGSIEDIQKRLKNLEDAPEPPKTVLKTVDKETDGKTPAPEKTDADKALAEIKKIHGNPPTWAYSK